MVYERNYGVNWVGPGKMLVDKAWTKLDELKMIMLHQSYDDKVQYEIKPEEDGVYIILYNEGENMIKVEWAEFANATPDSTETLIWRTYKSKLELELTSVYKDYKIIWFSDDVDCDLRNYERVAKIEDGMIVGYDYVVED